MVFLSCCLTLNREAVTRSQTNSRQQEGHILPEHSIAQLLEWEEKQGKEESEEHHTFAQAHGWKASLKTFTASNKHEARFSNSGAQFWIVLPKLEIYFLGYLNAAKGASTDQLRGIALV